MYVWVLAKARRFLCNFWMKHQRTLNEATWLCILESVWMFRGHRVGTCTVWTPYIRTLSKMNNHVASSNVLRYIIRSLWTGHSVVAVAIRFESKLKLTIFGIFDPANNMICNQNKYLSGWPNRYLLTETSRPEKISFLEYNNCLHDKSIPKRLHSV